MKKGLLILTLSVIMASCSKNDEKRLQEIITSTEDTIRPLAKMAALAYWNGTITGDPAEFKKYSDATIQITKVFSNPDTFAELKTIKERGKVKDSLLTRQLTVLYNQFLANQADTSLLNAIINKTSALELKYAEYRANFKGKPITDNEVESILKTSTDSKVLEEVWRAHKEIGPVVANDIIELVKMRNKVATSLGFDNYHSMTLELSGQDPKEISAIFDELDSLTKDAFVKVKGEMDSVLSLRYKTASADLMPWHYQGRYFQESPNIYPVNLDSYYKGKNLEKLTSNFYNSIGIDITKVMQNSDLYEKPKKNQHAYCTDIDNEGDIRVLCNIRDNEQWMGTMLHEFGHAAYSLGHDNPNNPYFLRSAAHTFTTEAIAMLFERLSRNPEWMKQALGLTQEEKENISKDCEKAAILKQLVFSRWVQVVYRFEKSMYENPDQDLNKLWWDLVEKYQMLKKPVDRNSPDWATKIHIALYPCYYHNYQLGELLASQIHYYIVDSVTKSGDYKNECYIGNKDIGNWMKEKIFNVGMRYEWNDMIERATGEKLTAKYFAKQFID